MQDGLRCAQKCKKFAKIGEKLRKWLQHDPKRERTQNTDGVREGLSGPLLSILRESKP